MITLFRLAYEVGEPLGLSRSEIVELQNAVVRYLGLPDRVGPDYLLMDDRADRARRMLENYVRL